MRCLIVGLIVLELVTVGCSATPNAQNTRSDQNSGQTAVTVAQPDVHDKEKVAWYVIDNLMEDKSTTVQQFINELYNFRFGDLDSDSNPEAVLVPKTGWLKVYSIDVYQGAYRCILNVDGGKYETAAKIEDPFLQITNKGGGTGSTASAMRIYHFRDQQILPVLKELALDSVFYDSNGAKTADTQGKITGSLSDFEYTVTTTKYNPINSAVTKKENTDHQKYIWNEEEFRYNIIELPKETYQVKKPQANLSGKQVLEQFAALIKARNYSEAAILCSPQLVDQIAPQGYSPQEVAQYLKDNYGSSNPEQIKLKITETTSKYVIGLLSRNPESWAGFAAIPEDNGWKIVLEEE